MEAFFRRMLGVMLLLVLLAGCREKKEAGRLEDSDQQLLQEISSIVRPMDEDAVHYKNALQSVAEYLDGTVDWASAMEALDRGLDEISQKLEDVPVYEVPSDLLSALEANEITPEEFCIFGNLRREELQSMRESLWLLAKALDDAEADPQGRENLSFYTECDLAVQQQSDFYYFYTINYWLALWPEEKNDTIRTQLLEQLLSFYPEGADWKYDRGEIEEELMVHLDQMEVWNMLWEDKIAISEEQWLQQARGEIS